MAKAFASQGDMTDKTISFTEIGPGLYAFTAEGDPNSGVIIGDDSVMVVEAQATPRLAQKVIDCIRGVTDKPISHVVLTHYHAVRVLGASAFNAPQVIMSEAARNMVAERGQEDWDSEFQRFPRLFQGHESIPGLTWPSTTFNGKMTVWLGKRRVDIRQLGRAHTAGDAVIHVPDANVMFTGDIVEAHSACYCGDGYFADWGTTLEAIRAFDLEAIAPGRGDAVIGSAAVNAALDRTKDFVDSTYRPVARVAARNGSLKEAWDAARAACDPKFKDYAIYEHCLPFNVARAYDEARGITHPRIWTAQRDLEMLGRFAGLKDKAMKDLVPDRYAVTMRLYPYAPSPDQGSATTARHKVVIIGGGPVGLATALDLGRRGVPVVLLDDHEGTGQGSKAICFAKRTLEICDRLGAAGPMLEKGVQWNVGKVFHDDRLLYEFNLLPEGGHAFPAFINLQQPWFEKYLHDAIVTAQGEGAPIEMRGKNRVDAVTPGEDHSLLEVMTPDGPYQLAADWLIVCDGARSPVRGMLGLNFDGRVFEDNFLIADVKMKAEFPTERWFWFEPHFKSGDSALLHKQPDDIWRIDFQLGWNIDRAKELQPANIRARVDAMLGPNVDYELDWCSIYTFQCRRMDRFRHGRVIFAGDSAHQVSPFGARGANSGIQDVDNLGWKLALVIKGDAPDALLDSYDMERVHGADENILNSSRATDFITPKSAVSKMFRNAVLALAEHLPFARTVVNSGRLSTPCTYDGSPLNGPDHPDMPARTRPGSPCPDAPLAGGWLLRHLGPGFTLLTINAEAPKTLSAHGQTIPRLALDATPEVTARYLGNVASAVYLIRPDSHVAARWSAYDTAAVTAALARAMGKDGPC